MTMQKNTALLFDATNVAPSTGRGEALPVGEYNVKIIEAEIRPTRGARIGKNTDAYVAFTFEVIDCQ